MRNRSREETDVGKPRTGFQYQATTAMNTGYSQKALLELYTKSSSNTKMQNGIEKMLLQRAMHLRAIRGAEV